jgi:hypothetical protein
VSIFRLSVVPRRRMRPRECAVRCYTAVSGKDFPWQLYVFEGWVIF